MISQNSGLLSCYGQNQSLDIRWSLESDRRVITQVEVQTQIFVWSDFLDQNYIWIDYPDGN